MLYLVGPLIESRLGDHLFDTRFVVLVSFSRQMAGHVPKWHFMWLANTEFCRYLSIIMEVTYIFTDLGCHRYWKSAHVAVKKNRVS